MAAARNIQVELNCDDLTILQNALNEVLNGLDQSEFQTRVGYSRMDVLRLHDRINQINKQLLFSEAPRL